jgi:acyl-coenzyme A synthetase/AMP-(fatty) acid ligase
VIENIYGPTELTIACTAYRWDNRRSPDESEQGIVPIGQPFDGMRALIVDEQLREVEPGRDGELLMTGPQLSLGYWQDGEKTRRAFVPVAGKNGTYYRTGDRVRQPGPGNPLVYLGRFDNQIKVLGHRVELGEVEAAVRQVSGLEGVVALGWPTRESRAKRIEVFLETDSFDTMALVNQLKAKLPVYMLPHNVLVLRRFPLNANGKYDRKALQLILENTFGSDQPQAAIPHPAGDAV